MSFDADTYRRSSLDGWEEAAPGWVRRQEMMREFAASVSHWMVDAISPQPGQRVLELAAGLGETGMLVAELVAPLGGVVISDQAEAMLEGARARSLALGLSNVEFQVLNAEWIDLPLASVDGVVCRWGYMLLADPGAALAETRRVLRPGGRVALAVWDALERNPWALLPAQELIERGLAPGPQGPGPAHEPGERSAAGEPSEPRPGPFALGSAEAPRRPARAGRVRGGARRGVGARPPPQELRRAVGDHARPVAQLPRRRPQPPGGGDRADRSVARTALRRIHVPRRDARDPGPHARGVRERLSVAAEIACGQ